MANIAPRHGNDVARTRQERGKIVAKRVARTWQNGAKKHCKTSRRDRAKNMATARQEMALGPTANWDALRR
jgi:hypothetical protein